MMSEHAKHMRWCDTTRHAKHVPEEGGEKGEGDDGRCEGDFWHGASMHSHDNIMC